MSTIANISALDWVNSSAVTFAIAEGSGGDGSPAKWRVSGYTSYAAAPEIRFAMRDTKKGAGRAGRVTFVYPHTSTDSTTGLTTVHCLLRGSADFSFDKDVPIAIAQNAVSLFFSALASRAAGNILEGFAGNTAPR